MDKDEIIEGLHRIIDAYGQDEGYVPRRVHDLYDKYHLEWDKKKYPEVYESLERTTQELKEKYRNEQESETQTIVEEN